MTPDQFRRVEQLFAEAVDLSPGDRDSFLQEACRDDTAVRRNVRAMLSRDGRDHRLLDLTATDLGVPIETDDLAPPQIPDHIGPYRILGILGHGGMGVVYRARQGTPDRDVALKVMRPGLRTTRMIRRFQRESSLLARLQHPGIARVYDAGTADTPQGPQPYFAMELIDGQPVLEFARARRLNVRERVALLIRICDAMRHAHQRGVIHRDLKPGNILVTVRDEQAHPTILDFGIARPLDAAGQATTQHTEGGQLVGTLAYMAPEQILGTDREIDTRSDVHALGVVAFELLTGELPIDIRDKPLPEAARLLTESAPRTLSAIDRTLRGDLETIVSKATDHEKRGRYQSATELAADLQRYLDDEPIVARPASAVYQLRKFARRHRPIVAAAISIVAVLAIAVTVSMTLYVRAESRAERLRRAVYAQNISLARNAFDDHDVIAAQQFIAACPEDLRGWEWRRLQYLSDNSTLALEGHDSAVLSVAWTPDGTRVVTGGGFKDIAPDGTRDCTVRIWDAESGALLRVLDDHVGPVHALAVSPDGSTIVSGGGPHWTQDFPRDPHLRVWNARTGALVARIPADDVTTWSIAFVDERTVVVGGETLNIALIDIVTGERRVIADGIGSIKSVAVAPDGSWIVATGWERRVRCHDLDSLELRWETELPEPGVSLAVDPPGDRVAVSGIKRSVRILDAHTGALVRRLEAHDSVRTLAFTPDGSALIAAGDAQTVQILDLDTGGERAVYRGATGSIYGVAVDPSGTRVAGASADRRARIWPARPSDSVVIYQSPREVNEAHWSPDGRRAAFVADDPLVGLWDGSTSSLQILEGHAKIVMSAAFGPDGTDLYSGDADGTVIAWDIRPERGRERKRWIAHGATVCRIAVSADGAILATAGTDGVTRLWDREGRMRREHVDPAVAVLGLGFSDDGARYLMADRSGGVRICATETGRVLVHEQVSDAPLRSLAVHDELLAVSNGEGELQIWDWRRWRRTLRIRAHVVACRSVAFSHDGRRLISAADDGRIKLYDTSSGNHLLTINAHDNHAYGAALDPADRRLLSCGADGAVRVWSAE